MEDGRKCEEGKQSNLDFRCRKMVNAAQKPCGQADQKRFGDSVLISEVGIASSTPEKSSERLTVKGKEDAIELPERYKAIVELFRQMTCSLRLLSLCKKSTTFHNICPQVEILAKRKFSYKHLGQIKYILPEAVQIFKILVHDEESQCMKPDLKIVLVFDVVKDHKQKSDFIALCQLFISRVNEYFSTHSEDYDIPEATLPHKFGIENEPASSETILPITSVGASSTVDIELSKDSSFMTFQMEQLSVENTAAQRVNPPPIPMEVTYSLAGCSRPCDSPGAKHISEAVNCMVETPAQLKPKRATLETDDSHIAISKKESFSSEKPAKRSLNFTHEKASEYVLANSMGKDVHVQTSCQEIPQNLRPKDYATKNKVIINEEDNDGGSSFNFSGPYSDESNTEMICKMPSSLHACVTIIHQIFQSVNYSPITKQELLFKTIINSPDVVERGIVEEQLDQLESLLPNWISKRMSPSGDLMYSIKKLSDIRIVLAELQN